MHATDVRRSGPPTLEVVTLAPEGTRALAAALAGVARAGDRLALVGPLGAGKTQFAKGFARGLGVDAVVNSPSFTLMAEYDGRLRLYHQDLYRLSGPADAFDGGLVDERQDDGVTITEWADRLGREVDPDRLLIRFDVVDETSRRLTLLDGVAARHDHYLQAAAAWAASGS